MLSRQQIQTLSVNGNIYIFFYDNKPFVSYIGVILHPYCVIPMYVCTIMHVCIISTKSGPIKTLIAHAVYCILNGLHS